MFAYSSDSEDYAVSCRPTQERRKMQRVYSPRFERRYAKSSALGNGAHRRGTKRQAV